MGKGSNGTRGTRPANSRGFVANKEELKAVDNYLFRATDVDPDDVMRVDKNYLASLKGDAFYDAVDILVSKRNVSSSAASLKQIIKAKPDATKYADGGSTAHALRSYQKYSSAKMEQLSDRAKKAAVNAASEADKATDDGVRKALMSQSKGYVAVGKYLDAMIDWRKKYALKG